MHLTTATVLLLLGMGAGLFGALAGIGGGIILTPVLTLFFHLPIRQAIGTSLVAVIATSTATSAVNVENHRTDVRLGVTLEIATTMGAAIAALVAAYVNRTTLAVLFSIFLLYSGLAILRREFKGAGRPETLPVNEDASAPERAAGMHYKVKNYKYGLPAALVAGGLSGLLGIGGGPVKVPIMYLFMGVPVRVATATSNFMIGVTAATSAYIYYGRGNINLTVAAPLVSGVFLGSQFGAHLAPRVKVRHISLLLALVMLYLTGQMLYKIAMGAL